MMRMLLHEDEDDGVVAATATATAAATAGLTLFSLVYLCRLLCSTVSDPSQLHSSTHSSSICLVLHSSTLSLSLSVSCRYACTSPKYPTTKCHTSTVPESNIVCDNCCINCRRMITRWVKPDPEYRVLSTEYQIPRREHSALSMEYCYMVYWVHSAKESTYYRVSYLST